MSEIAVVHRSGYGHTQALAEALGRRVAEATRRWRDEPLAEAA